MLAHGDPACRLLTDRAMFDFGMGLMVGLALGLIVIGFLAIAAYQRGYEDAFGRRKQWRAELVARQAAVRMPAVAARKAS
jgi:hypothetical protein